MPAACAPCAARVALRAPGFAPPDREAAAAGDSSDKKIQEQGMRKIIEADGTVVAVIIAAAFICLALSAPGFTVDEASTVAIAAHQEVRR